MTLAHLTRVASIIFGTVVCGVTPMRLMASGPWAPQAQPPQATPAKASADVPQPTSLPAALPTRNPIPDATSAAEPAAEHFAVEYAEGKVTVDATNASLNKLLHEVAAKAGIRITGAVSDERVFGQYGPAKPSIVLAALLDGTGTNILLVDDARGGSELVLTQRSGGATPPNPMASALETTTDAQDGRPTSRYVNPGRGFQPPGPGRGPLAQPPNFGPPAAQGAGPGGAVQGDPQAPGDSRTPQQIYDQLQEAQKPQ